MTGLERLDVLIDETKAQLQFLIGVRELAVSLPDGSPERDRVLAIVCSTPATRKERTPNNTVPGLIIESLRRGPMAVAEIAKAAGLHYTTVYRFVKSSNRVVKVGRQWALTEPVNGVTE